MVMETLCGKDEYILGLQNKYLFFFFWGGGGRSRQFVSICIILSYILRLT